MTNYVGSRLQISTRDGKYEGILHSIDPVTKMISLGKAKALPSGKKYLGLLTFFGQEIENLQVLVENEQPEKVGETHDSPPQKQVQDTSHGDTDLTRQDSYTGPTSDKHQSQFQETCNNYQEQPGSNLDWPSDLDPPYSQEVTISNEQGDGIINTSEVPPLIDGTQDGTQDICDQVDGLRLYGEDATQSKIRNPLTMTSADSRLGHTEMNYIIINKEDEKFCEAMEDIKSQYAIGLTLKGVQLGRRGKVSLLMVLCEDRVYMFDALALGPNLFPQHFKEILESESIAKVIHDSRFVSDLLYHQFFITLRSVFDTQVGDILIKKRQYMDFPRNVSGTTECILEYLDVGISDIALHLEATKKISEDESSWLKRPLSAVNMRCAYIDTVYLLRLREAIEEQLMAEFTCAIDLYLGVERDRLQLDTSKSSTRASYVPRELIHNLHHKVASFASSANRVKPPELTTLDLSNDSARQARTGTSPTLGAPGPPRREEQEQYQNPQEAHHHQVQQQQLQRSKQKRRSMRRAGSPEERGRILPWKMQFGPQGVTAKPVRGRPAIPPLMTHSKLDDGDEEDQEDRYTTDSEDDSEGEAFNDQDQSHLWQHRCTAFPPEMASSRGTKSTSSPLKMSSINTLNINNNSISPPKMSFTTTNEKNSTLLPNKTSASTASTDFVSHKKETMREAFDRLQQENESDSMQLGSQTALNVTPTRESGILENKNSNHNRESITGEATLGFRGNNESQSALDSRSPDHRNPLQNLSQSSSIESFKQSPQRQPGQPDFSLPNALDIHTDSQNAHDDQSTHGRIENMPKQKEKTLKLTDMRQHLNHSATSRDIVRNTSSGDEKPRIPCQPPSYADALFGKKRETFTVPQSKTLRALGMALVAGKPLMDEDVEDDEEKEEGDNDKKDQEQSEGHKIGPRPVPSRGRGRASLLTSGNVRMLGERSPGGLTSRGLSQSIQVTFPSSRGMSDEGQSQTATVNGCFMSQRAL